jgi:hypothetical protein
VIAVWAGVLLACASGDGKFDESPDPGFGEDAGTTDGSSATSKFDSNGDPASSSGPGEDEDPTLPTPPDLGMCGDDGDCVLEDDSCFEQFGACVDGSCTFPPKLAGVPCDDGDACTDQDVCNGIGMCVGAMIECGACDEGWGDCNGDEADGCETPLDTASHCGDCGLACEAGAHASAACEMGECVHGCDAPWENCDGDWANGCEIPTGVANQCDVNGLNDVNGCWTAHCGSSNNVDARNFGTWYCFECSTCNVPSSGQCRWCNHDTGNWYDPASCVCGSYEDDVCAP